MIRVATSLTTRPVESSQDNFHSLNSMDARNTPEPGQHRIQRLCSGHLVNDPTITQQQKQRYAAHAKARRQELIILGVYLDHGCLAGQCIGYCSHHRCE